MNIILVKRKSHNVDESSLPTLNSAPIFYKYIVFILVVILILLFNG